MVQAGDEVKTTAREFAEKLCRTYERELRLNGPTDELNSALNRYVFMPESTM